MRATMQAMCNENHGWRSCASRLLSILGVVLGSSSGFELAHAATIQKVQKDKTKIVVSLSQSELSTLEEEDHLVVEYGGVAYTAVVRVISINVLKKTAVLEFDEAQARVQKRQNLRVVSTMWNMRSSPLMQDFGQYHQFSRSDVEFKAGLFNQSRKATIRSPGTESLSLNSATDGYAVRLGSYVLFDPRWFGAGIGYEYHSANVRITGIPEREEANSVLLTRLEPGMWFEVVEHWRLSLRVDYVTSERKRNAENTRSVLTHDFTEYRIGLVNYGPQFEMGLQYKDRAEFTAVDSVPGAAGAGSTIIEDRMRLPAEVSLFGRKVFSPDFVWGAGFAYVFYQRDEVKGAPLASKPKPYEMFKFHTGFEHRLGTGDKFDWILHYAGARTLDDLLQQRLSDSAGVTVSYQNKFWEGFTGGALLRAEGGSRIEEQALRDVNSGEKILDAESGEELRQHISHRAYAYWLQIFARYEFDLLSSRGRRS